MPFLCLFGSVNMMKGILPNENDIFAFIMLPKGFEVLIDEACLINSNKVVGGVS